jgi:hypothetical protein
MSAIASMTLNDGVTATRTFTPIASTPPVYRDLSDANVPDVGQAEITIQVFRAKKSGVHRVRHTTRTPVLESASGGTASGYVAAPAVAFTPMAVTDYYKPQRSTPAQMAILRNLHMNGAANVQLVDAIEKNVQPT